MYANAKNKRRAPGEVSLILQLSRASRSSAGPLDVSYKNSLSHTTLYHVPFPSNQSPFWRTDKAHHLSMNTNQPLRGYRPRDEQLFRARSVTATSTSTSTATQHDRLLSQANMKRIPGTRPWQNIFLASFHQSSPMYIDRYCLPRL